MANSTGKIASAGAAKAATAAPPKAKKTSPKPAPPAKGSAKGKSQESALSEVPINNDNSPPPSDSTRDKGHTTNLNDSFSYSSEGYSSRNVTTEGTARLVDNLVENYTGDYSGIESHDHDSFHKNSAGSRTSEYTEHGHDCPHAPSEARTRFQKIEEADQQLGVAQKKVEVILDKAVEARLNDTEPVPAAEEKRAEEEQERLTKAEGRLHRTRERLAEKQEFRRQRKLEYTAKREDAEKALLAKYGNSSAALRDHIMETFRPVIAQDSDARNDIQQLQNAADWHIRTDSEASRLAKEAESATPRDSQRAIDAQDRLKNLDGEKRETKLFATTEEKKKVEKERRKSLLKEREQKKRQDVERRLEGGAFRDKVRNTADGDRTNLVEAELKKLDKNTPTQLRKELECRLNEQLSKVQVEQTKSAHKEDDKRRKSVDTLLATRAKRSGSVGQELNPISEAVEDLDSESIQKTHKRLVDLDLGSVNSVVDLERAFGRDVTDVRIDLEQQIARGGKSTPKARKTLSSLDRLVRRSQLMSEGDGWDALMSCITPSGPNLGRFLGIPDSGSGGRSSGVAELKTNSQVDFVAARRISRRMAQSGSRVDEKRKARLIAQLGSAG